jgi:hypothetical protein
MQLPDYWLTRPALPTDPAALAAFDRLVMAARAHPGAPLDYTLPAPKWQFLCHASEQYNLAMHGSGDAQIAVFEPRQSNDLNEFGNRKAVYAAADGIWAMFFAIVDRSRVQSITNGCIRLVDPAGKVSDPLYIFSVSREALPQKPWRSGSVYLLPRETFVEQAPMPFGEYQVRIAQLASLEPVTPLARLDVTPQDFPFLDQIRGHDDSRLEEYARALQTGGPWPEG